MVYHMFSYDCLTAEQRAASNDTADAAASLPHQPVVAGAAATVGSRGQRTTAASVSDKKFIFLVSMYCIFKKFSPIALESLPISHHSSSSVCRYSSPTGPATQTAAAVGATTTTRIVRLPTQPLHPSQALPNQPLPPAQATAATNAAR